MSPDSTPIVLPRPAVVDGRVDAGPDGLVERVDGYIVHLTNAGMPRIIDDPQRLAAALVAVHDHATDPQPEETTP